MQNKGSYNPDSDEDDLQGWHLEVWFSKYASNLKIEFSINFIFINFNLFLFYLIIKKFY